MSAPTVDGRIAGVREALVRRRIDPDPDPGRVRLGDPADMKFVRALLAGKQADAFICANDHTAATLLRSLESTGVKVPRDVRVVGFDDARYATLVSVPLTEIHQPCRDIAIIAFRAMLIGSPSRRCRCAVFRWHPGWSSGNPAAPISLEASKRRRIRCPAR